MSDSTTTIRVDHTTRRRLRLLAALQGETMTEIAKRAIGQLPLPSSVNCDVDSRHAITPCDDTACATGLIDMPQAGVAAPASDSRLAG